MKQPGDESHPGQLVDAFLCTDRPMWVPRAICGTTQAPPGRASTPLRLPPYQTAQTQTQEEFDEALLASLTVYVGNMSFYTEVHAYKQFSHVGEIKRISMGLNKNQDPLRLVLPTEA